ncbi:hypothetical protein FQA39_LY10381 [Lamprigera yunnana]|nr:hypothetical protein FQA39_LY10381 [Lamprigera yunnana]
MSASDLSVCFICENSLNEGEIKIVKEKGVTNLIKCSAKRQNREHELFFEGPKTYQCFLCGEGISEDFFKKQERLPEHERNLIHRVMGVKETIADAAENRGDECGKRKGTIMDFIYINQHQIHLFIALLLDEDHNRNFLRLQRRRLRDEMDPFEMAEGQFIRLFRLNAQSVINLVQDLLPHIPNRNNNAISLTQKVRCGIGLSFSLLLALKILVCITEKEVSEYAAPTKIWRGIAKRYLTTTNSDQAAIVSWIIQIED